jgi:hypothetical protein
MEKLAGIAMSYVMVTMFYIGLIGYIFTYGGFIAVMVATAGTFCMYVILYAVAKQIVTE